MPRKSIFTLWVIFWMISGLTVIVTRRAWMLHSYESMLTALGWISVIVALIILAASGWRAVPLGLLCAGLLVGQWWFVKLLAAQLLWAISGFAP
jgi:hypothetical protein